MSSTETWRVNFFVLGVFMIAGLVTYRLFNLTFVRHEAFVKTAKSQYESPTALLSGRGSIYFSDLSASGGPSMDSGPRGRKLAAANRSSIYLFSNNKIIDQPPAQISGQLAAILNQDPAALEIKLGQKDKSYQVLAAGLTEDQTDKIKSLKIKGIGTSTQIDRFYSLGASAGQVLGFVGYDAKQRVGQYGIEAYYDDILSGVEKSQEIFGNKTYVDFLRFLKFWRPNAEVEPRVELNALSSSLKTEGSDLVLTIDKNIQALAESSLEQVLKKWSSPSGTIIVQDPKSGEILAMVSSPSFDPNRYFDYDLEDFINPAYQKIYEPGSSFKPITMAAAVDTGAVRADTTYNDTGRIEIAGYEIKNFDERAHGAQTMRQVLEKSLNTGAMFAQQRAGDDAFLNYVVGFGFGQKTAVDLSGEVSGNISNLYSGRKINFATASFGQGIAVTPLQLINGYSAIANGGKLMWPHLVKEIVRPDGSKVEIQPKIIGSPVGEETARRMQAMLVGVVDVGFDKARIKGYDVAGKTGTAQIPAPTGGYLANDQFVHNFVGFAPAYNPRFAILIKMDRPKGIKFAADSLSPVFGDIARFLIRYFNIPPTRQ